MNINRATAKFTDITARRREVGRLYLQGWTQPEIAEEFEVSQPTISRDLAALREEWLQSALVDFNEARSKELAKIDALELEYWEAWHRSIQDAERETKKAIAVGDKEVKREATKTTEGQAGDPRFLSGVQWCINKRCEILGLDAPKQHTVNWRNEVERAGVDASELFNKLVGEYVAVIGSGDQPTE